MAPLAASILLIALPVAFNAAFAALAAKFDYPDILRKPTAEILDRFRRGGAGLVTLWWSFAMTAVLFVPLAILLPSALDEADPAVLALSVGIGVLAGTVQFLGLIRWAFMVPYLARAYHADDANAETRAAIDVVFQSFNRYLGVAVGEHLGYLLTGAWSVLVGVALLQQGTVLPAVGVAGVVIGIILALCALEFVGPFEEKGWRLAGIATPFVYIAWSLWLIVTGIVLLF